MDTESIVYWIIGLVLTSSLNLYLSISTNKLVRQRRRYNPETHDIGLVHIVKTGPKPWKKWIILKLKWIIKKLGG